MSALLEVTGLSRQFGGLRAVSEIDFTLDEGEIVGLIGPNGAGKSTIFNLVNGVLTPHRGRIAFAGIDITGWPPHRVVRQGLARTHQIVRPLNGMTVLDNCVVGGCFGRETLSLTAARKKSAEVLDFVGLGDQADALATHLTIAGKQRLEIARALYAGPRLLLLDEVLAGLRWAA